MKKISVIIPVYNVESYLKRCIESVLKQSYSNLEVILVNDGSTDNSGDICNQFSLLDKRVQVIHQKNLGVSRSRNTGIRYSTGDYITFVDSDDYIENDMYEILVNNIEENNADISVCKSRIIYENSNEKITDEKNEKKLLLKEDAIESLICNMDNAVWNKLYKYEIIKNIRFNENITHGEDFYFNLQAFKNCELIIYDNRCKYNYIKRGNSITTSMFSIKSFDEVKSKDLIYEYILNYFPQLELKARRLPFISRLNIFRKIFITGNEKKYKKEIVEYRKYMNDNYLAIKHVLKRKEVVEYSLLRYSFGLYLLTIKFLNRRKI